METIRARDYRYDNIKALIMLGIVATHFVDGYAHGKLYYFMIMMHMYDMPVFVWISGRFAGFDWKRMLKKLVYPYVLFQLLYLLFMNYVLHQPKQIQFHQPFFLLWYMMAMIQWSLTVPLMKRVRGGWRWVYLSGAVALSLAVGYVQKIGYDWNLARMFYFYPFFAAGYFTKDCAFRMNKKWTVLLVAGTALILGVLYFADLNINVAWWYGAYPYRNPSANYTPLHRLLMYAIAITIGGCILCLMPSKMLPFSYVGRNLTPVYFWHGLLVLAIRPLQLQRYLPGRFAWWVFVEVISVATVLLLAAPPVMKFTKPLMSWPFSADTLKMILRREKQNAADSNSADA